MTALDRYTRLEALGQWREAPEQDPQEVVVSFGNATLVLSDLNEIPLCHWAMAATSRMSLEGSKAVYTPDTEGFETLEIDDAEMVEAIAQVSRAAVTVNRRTPWLRWVFLMILVSIIAAISYVTPTLLRDQALRMTSLESARKMGTDMVATLGVKICREARADAARELFQSRVFPDGRTLLVIANNQPQVSVFPGGVILIGGNTLQNIQTPNELADLVTALAAENETSVARLFEASSLRELFEYITSGTLSKSRLADAANSIINAPNVGATMPAVSGESHQLILRDQDWVALQGICLE